MTTYSKFKRILKEIELISKNEKLIKLTNEWISEANQFKYSYHFEWLGRPIIQYPWILSQCKKLWEVKPDLIIETGIAHEFTYNVCINAWIT